MTFEFTIGNTHTTMDLSTLVILVLVVGFFVWLICWSFRQGIRTLQGKPLNSPPSPIFWAKVSADIVEEDEEDLWHGIPEAFQASYKAKKGTAITNHDGYMKRVRICKVAYTYCGERYTSFVQDCVIRDGKTEVYCYKRKPALTKLYIPDQSWSKGAGISLLFFGGFLLLMGFVAICGAIS